MVVCIDHIAMLVDFCTSIMLKGVLQSHEIKLSLGDNLNLTRRF